MNGEDGTLTVLNVEDFNELYELAGDERPKGLRWDKEESKGGDQTRNCVPENAPCTRQCTAWCITATLYQYHRY